MKKTATKLKHNRSITPETVNGERATKPELIKPIAPEVPTYDELLAFAMAYRNGGIFVPVPPSQFNGVSFYGNVAAITLFQSGKFKIELTLLGEGALIPDFNNPLVDSLVTIISGEVGLNRNHQPVSFGGVKEAPMENGVSNLNGQCVRISPKDTFGAQAGTISASFLAFHMRVDGRTWPISGTPDPT